MSSAPDSLQKVVEGVHSVTRPIRFFGVETGTRMTVLQLSEGGLLVHSPVALDGALEAAVRALGEVRVIVAPSLFHHLAVPGWMTAFPEAAAYCTPGLETKRADIRWTGVLGDAPLEAWKADVDQVLFSARSLENEVVFFHRPSRTFVCCDAVFNLATHPSRLTRAIAWALGNHRPGATRLEHWMMRKHHVQGRAQVDRMLAWHPERILLAHGAPVLADGERVLAEAYAWL